MEKYLVRRLVPILQFSAMMEREVALTSWKMPVQGEYKAGRAASHPLYGLPRFLNLNIALRDTNVGILVTLCRWGRDAYPNQSNHSMQKACPM